MNYDEIKAAAKQYADRKNVEIDDSMNTFIIMAESRINRLLKTRQQSNRMYTYTIEGEEYYPLPTDFAGMRDIQLNSALPSEEHSTTPMEMLTPALFNSQRNKPYCGTMYYSIIANQFQIFPVQEEGKSIEIVYFQKVPGLTEELPSNWLATTNPDIYISGIISEIERFVKNYDVSNMWYDRMTVAIGELDSYDVEERWSGTPLTTRVEL